MPTLTNTTDTKRRRPYVFSRSNSIIPFRLTHTHTPRQVCVRHTPTSMSAAAGSLRGRRIRIPITVHFTRGRDTTSPLVRGLVVPLRQLDKDLVLRGITGLRHRLGTRVRRRETTGLLGRIPLLILNNMERNHTSHLCTIRWAVNRMSVVYRQSLFSRPGRSEEIRETWVPPVFTTTTGQIAGGRAIPTWIVIIRMMLVGISAASLMTATPMKTTEEGGAARGVVDLKGSTSGRRRRHRTRICYRIEFFGVHGCILCLSLIGPDPRRLLPHVHRQ
jgi:hypothetical protein